MFKINSLLKIIIHLIITISAFTGLSNCTGALMSFAYNRADAYVLGKVDDYLDLNRLQKKLLAVKLKEIHAWHKKVEFPKYAPLIREINKAVQSGLTRKTYRELYKKVEARRNALLLKTIPGTVEILMSLSNDQIDHFADETLNDIKKLEKELKNKDRLKERTEKIFEQIEEYTGDWSSEKEKNIKGRITRIPDTLPAFVKHRYKRREYLLQLIREKKREELKKNLVIWYTNPRQGYDENYLPHFDQMVDGWEKFTLFLAANLQEKHKKYLAEKTEELATRIEGILK